MGKHPSVLFLSKLFILVGYILHNCNKIKKKTVDPFHCVYSLSIVSFSSTEDTKFVHNSSYRCHPNQTFTRVILPDCAACSLPKILCSFVRSQTSLNSAWKTSQKLHSEVFSTTTFNIENVWNKAAIQTALYLITHQEERGRRHAGGGGLLGEAFRQPRPVS